MTTCGEHLAQGLSPSLLHTHLCVRVSLVSQEPRTGVPGKTGSVTTKAAFFVSPAVP